MDDNLISIIVPVYKAEAYLDECISSIINQTYRNLEIILVDDGSPDGCPQICDNWAEIDSRIRVIHKQNGGASSARNAGLEIARGEYIGFVDSDDIIAADMYEILLEAVCSSGKKVACCGMTKDGKTVAMPSNRKRLGTKTFDTKQTVNGILEGWCGTSFCQRLFHNTVLKEIHFPEGETNEEYSLLIPFTVVADGMVYIPEQLYYYRHTQESVTDTYWKKCSRIVLQNLERMEKQLERYQLDCMAAFSGFRLRNVFSLALALDKNLHCLSEEAKQTHKIAVRIMRENLPKAMTPGTLSVKDRILYMMIVTRTLRPVYKLINKPLR